MPLNCDKEKSVPVSRPFPPWIRVRIPAGDTIAAVEKVLRQQHVRTVCRGAACPNATDCFGRGTATFMILGGVCTRACRFCAVQDGTPQAPEQDEPERVAAAAHAMKLRHVVLTSVTRDDLADGGAGHFAAVVRAIRRVLPRATTEVLVPDFQENRAAVETVLASAPDVFNHNLETVRRLQAMVRPQADYQRSLQVLRIAAAWRPRVWIKSGLMVGLGETDDEIRQAMEDLHAAGCELLTIGQYLAPSTAHCPVQRFVEPAMFDVYARWAREIGFREASAGPLVRSSFQAGKLFRQARRTPRDDGDV